MLGIALLSIILLKVCSFFVSHFSSGSEPFSMEKSTEEGKDTKEEAFDKNEKKLLTCELFSTENGYFTWVSIIPVSICSYVMQIVEHPLKTVPTPPPDKLV